MRCLRTITLAIIFLTLAVHAEVIEKQYDVTSGGTLYLDTKVSGDVLVSGWEKDVAHVIVRLRGRDCEDLEILTEERGGNIYVSTDNRFNDWNNDCDLEFEINIPAVFDTDLESNGGDFMITNLTGKLEGSTMGGDLDLVRLTGDLHFTTMGGEVELRNSEVDGLVKTMGGNVTIRDVIGDVKGKTMGGNVYYKNVTSKNGGSLETSTMGGNIDIHSPDQSVKASTMGGNIDASGKEVNVSTMGGDIDVNDAPNGAKVHTMGGDIYIKSVGNYAKAKTMGGDIDIDALAGWAKATTMGGDIRITMIGNPDEGDRNLDLTSFGGEVYLSVPDGLDAEFDIELTYTKNSRRNYKIVSDFELDIEETEEWERTMFFGEANKKILATGTVGDGSNLIQIKTTNGNITIKQD